MQNKTIKLFGITELKQEIKEKVVEKFRSENQHDFLSDDLENDLYELMLENNIKSIRETPKLFYSLSYCQGDGLCFEGSFNWKNYKVYIKHSGNYYHSNSVEIDIKTLYGNEAKEGVYSDFKEIYKDICELLETKGYSYIEDQNEEAYIIEDIEANDYLFLSDGTIFKDKWECV